MGLRTLTAGLIVFASTTFAQVAPDDAAVKLRERQAARAAVASQPSTVTRAEADALVQQVRALRSQLQEAQAQIGLLRAELAKAKAPPAKQVEAGKPATLSEEKLNAAGVGSPEQLAEDGPGIYRVVAHYRREVIDAPATTDDFKARSRAVAISIAERKGYDLRKRYDADGAEQVVNLWKIKSLGATELSD